jgi:hypothetical protein
LTAEGLGVETTLVAVVALLTVSLTTLEGELVLKFEFELVNVAVTGCVAGGPGKANVQAGAIPAEVKVTEHSVVLVSVSV